MLGFVEHNRALAGHDFLPARVRERPTQSSPAPARVTGTRGSVRRLGRRSGPGRCPARAGIKRVAVLRLIFPGIPAGVADACQRGDATCHSGHAGVHANSQPITASPHHVENPLGRSLRMVLDIETHPHSPTNGAPGGGIRGSHRLLVVVSPMGQLETIARNSRDRPSPSRRQPVSNRQIHVSTSNSPACPSSSRCLRKRWRRRWRETGAAKSWSMAPRDRDWNGRLLRRLGAYGLLDIRSVSHFLNAQSCGWEFPTPPSHP